MNAATFNRMVQNVTPRGSPRDVLHLAVLQDITCSNAGAFEQGLQALKSRGVRKLSLDLSTILIIDSTGIGCLVKVHKAYLAVDGTVTLVDPVDAIQNILKILKLDQILPVVFSEQEGPEPSAAGDVGMPMPAGVPGSHRDTTPEESIVKRLELAELIEEISSDTATGRVRIALKSNVTVANAKLFGACLEFYEKDTLEILEIDFSRIDFMDSSGIGVLAATVRSYRGSGGKVVVIGPNAGIRTILKVVRLDSLVEIQDG